MKDSGDPQLGPIPAHWEFTARKRAMRKFGTGPAPVKNSASPLPRDGFSKAFSASGQDVWLPEPSASGPALILSAVGARSGRTFETDGEWSLVANTAAFRIDSNSVLRYWWYCTNCPDWWIKDGAAQPYVRIAASLAKKQGIPSASEQEDIVAFLDTATAEVDHAIASKRRLIDLLNEQKQSIISKAVTRGLDPTVEMKDSGVPWLDGIPKNWQVLRAKVIFQVVNERSISGTEDLLTVSSQRGITLREGQSVTMFKAQSYAGHKLCSPGDLVVNSLWAWAGGLGVSELRGIVSTAYSVYRPRAAYAGYARYLHQLLRSAAYRWELKVRSKGVWISRLQLSDESFMSMPILLPPIDEQVKIVSYLDQATSGIDEVIDLNQREIDLLEEYRTRLISDVVTGKVDVRGVAGPLAGPDSIDEVDEPATAAELGGAAVGS